MDSGRVDGGADGTEEGWAERADREGGHWDTALDVALPLLAGVGGAVISPEVADVDGWIGVFSATLAFSLGCALATWAVVAGKVTGWPAVFTVALSFAVSVYVAAKLGEGTLDIAGIQGAMADFGGPAWLRWLLAVTATAFTTFGVAGTLLGGGIGVWAGVRVARAPA